MAAIAACTSGGAEGEGGSSRKPAAMNCFSCSGGRACVSASSGGAVSLAVLSPDTIPDGITPREWIRGDTARE